MSTLSSVCPPCHQYVHLVISMSTLSSVCPPCHQPIMVFLHAANRREERNEEKAKEVRARYEKELSSLKVELKTLKSAKKEHAKALKMNVRTCMHVTT